MTKQRQSKRYDIIQLCILLAIVAAINVISAYVFKRFDLTAEKRYTLSAATETMLKKLDELIIDSDNDNDPRWDDLKKLMNNN